MAKKVKGKRGWVPKLSWGVKVNILYSHKDVTGWRKRTSFGGFYHKDKGEIILYSDREKEFFILKGTAAEFNRIGKVIDHTMTLEEAIMAIHDEGIILPNSVYSRLEWNLVDKYNPENVHLRALWLTV